MVRVDIKIICNIWCIVIGCNTLEQYESKYWVIIKLCWLYLWVYDMPNIWNCHNYQKKVTHFYILDLNTTLGLKWCHRSKAKKTRKKSLELKISYFHMKLISCCLFKLQLLPEVKPANLQIWDFQLSSKIPTCHVSYQLSDVVKFFLTPYLPCRNNGLIQFNLTFTDILSSN